MCGARAAAALGIVHHVVVEQGEGVHQLERGTGVDDDRRRRGSPPQPTNAQWQNAGRSRLPPGSDHPPDLAERAGEVGVERRPAIELGREEPLEPALDAIGDRPQAGWRVG